MEGLQSSLPPFQHPVMPSRWRSKWLITAVSQWEQHQKAGLGELFGVEFWGVVSPGQNILSIKCKAIYPFDKYLQSYYGEPGIISIPEVFQCTEQISLPLENGHACVELDRKLNTNKQIRNNVERCSSRNYSSFTLLWLGHFSRGHMKVGIMFNCLIQLFDTFLKLMIQRMDMVVLQLYSVIHFIMLNSWTHFFFIWEREGDWEREIICWFSLQMLATVPT